jgi:hypothetical protein
MVHFLAGVVAAIVRTILRSIPLIARRIANRCVGFTATEEEVKWIR